MKLTDKFTFGKFKGQTLKHVMAEKGSYVGWCLENIKDFHIEPEHLEKEFLAGYNEWKKTHKGMIVHSSSSSFDSLSIANKQTMRKFIETINNIHDEELAMCVDDD